jgi:hypothetical protein
VALKNAHEELASAEVRLSPPRFAYYPSLYYPHSTTLTLLPSLYHPSLYHPYSTEKAEA